MTEPEFTLSAATFLRRYGDGPKSTENAIRKELLAGDLVFTALERTIRLANTLIVRGDRMAGYAVEASKRAERILRLLSETIAHRYSLGDTPYPDPREAYPAVYDPNQFSGNAVPSRSEGESTLNLEDLQARYAAKREKTAALVSRAIRAEYPEGNDLLDATAAFAQIAFKLERIDPTAAEEARIALDELREISDGIKDEIDWKYNLGFCRTGGPP